MKTEELKALGLNDDQVQKVFAMHGEDVNREKQATTEAKAQLTAAQNQLQEANRKLEGYDPEWKQKAAQAQQEAQQQLDEMKAQYAAGNAASGLKFTSESAKKAFLADLAAKKLPLQEDGTLLGLEDFVKAYQKADPGAFAKDSEYPSVKDGGDPSTKPSGTTRDQFATWFNEQFKSRSKKIWQLRLTSTARPPLACRALFPVKFCRRRRKRPP